jgi:hypothetical protein
VDAKQAYQMVRGHDITNWLEAGDNEAGLHNVLQKLMMIGCILRSQ